jgi:hypothetical protein
MPSNEGLLPESYGSLTIHVFKRAVQVAIEKMYEDIYREQRQRISLIFGTLRPPAHQGPSLTPCPTGNWESFGENVDKELNRSA